MAVSYGYNRTRPRTKVTLDSSSLGSSNPASEKPIVLLGSATGGVPKEPVELTNFAQAREQFRGGDLVDAIELAWNPSPNVLGAGRIIAVRTDEATQASLTDGALTVNSKLYGEDANSIQVELSNNSLTGAKNFSVHFTKDRYEVTYANIGNIFNLKYTGEEAQAQVSITKDEDGKFAKTLTIRSGESESMNDVRSYELGEGVYEDVNVLVNDINNLPDFEATLDSLGGNKNVKSKFLDELTDQDIKTDSVKVTAVAGDLMNQVASDPYVEVEVDHTQAMPDTIAISKLSGGSTEASPASWGKLFSKVSDLGAYYIVPLSEESSVHGELAQYLRGEYAGGLHLRGIVGGGVNEGVESLRQRQMNLRHSRVSLVGDSGKRRMTDGRVLNVSGYLYAALVAGIASGLEIGEPLTYKHVTIESLDRKFTSDQLDQLDAAGVIMTEFVRTRSSSHYRIVSDPTTYNIPSEPVQNRISLGEVSDFLTSELRAIMDEEFIGSRIRNSSASLLKNRVESFLDNQKNVGGLIVDYRPDDVQVVISGNTARIQLTVQPSQGLDYINVHINYEDNELVG